MRALIIAPLLGAACAAPRVETRQYAHLGALRTVVVYDDPAQVSRECVRRTGALGDGGQPLTGTDACAGGGVVRLSARASALTLLHELRHVDGTLSPAMTEKTEPGTFPGTR